MNVRSRLHLRGQEVMTYLRLAWPMQARVRFVIFAQGRTGTWLLHDLLNAHPQIVCDKEILQPRRLAPYAFVEGRSRRLASVYGFHVQIRQLLEVHHLDPVAFLRRMEALGWRILYLRRQNILRQSISSLIAGQRRLWYTTNPAELAQHRFTIDLDELMAWLDRRQSYLEQEATALHGLPHLSLVYEDDLLTADQRQVTMTRIFAFLDVDPILVTAKTQRLSSDCLADMVENYQELVDRVASSPYRGFLA
ncbi:MAG: Nodulation protein H [Chloroflexi bacterium]|nr:Nodulation protein H [Chloroflexota bacterium]MBP6802594.1 Nodulation protein H [Chloroflexota bacterium]